MMGDAAMDALERRPVEQVRRDLEGRQIPAPIVNALADTQAHWGEFVRVSRANGGSIAAPINGRVLTAIFRDSANSGLASRLVASLSSLRPTTGSTTAMPEMVTTALNEFLAEGNRTEFARIVNDSRSRGLLMQALGALAPAGTHLPSSEDLGFLLEKNILTPENLRSIAATAIAHPDQIQASLTGLLSNSEIAARIAALTPEERTRVATIISAASGSTVTADQITAGATTMNAIQTAFGNDVAAQIQTAIAPGGQGPAAAVGIMYTNNAVRANEFLSNTTNLEAINTAMGGGTRTDALGVMLSTPAGRTALATLVQELSAIDPQAPMRLISALTPAAGQPQTTLNIGAIARALSPDNNRVQTARYLEVLRHFSTNLASVSAEPDSELGRLKASLAQVNDVAPRDVALAASLAEAPGVLDAVTRIKTAADQNVNGAFRLIMRDENLRHALAPTATETSVNLPELGRALGELARDDRGNLPLAFLTHRNPTSGNYGNLNATFSLIENLDRVTGGTGGTEATADNLNADTMSVVMAMAAGQNLEVNTNGGNVWDSRSDYRVKVPGTNRWISAKDMADLFAKPEVAAAFSQFFETASSVTGSPLQNVMAAMNENFWVDRNSNGQVDGNEGLISVLANGDSIGQVLQYWDEIRSGRFDGARPEGWFGRLDLSWLGSDNPNNLSYSIERMATDGRISGNKDALTAIGDAVNANPAIAAMHRAPRATVAAH
jgi:hypothetical protein